MIWNNLYRVHDISDKAKGKTRWVTLDMKNHIMENHLVIAASLSPAKKARIRPENKKSIDTSTQFLTKLS